MPLFRITTAMLIIVAGSAWVRCDEAAERAMLATYKLANSASTASALAIEFANSSDGPRQALFTAEHVLAKMRGPNCTLVSRQRLDDGTYEREELTIPIRTDSSPRWLRHPQHDLALLPVPADIRLEAIDVATVASANSMSDVHAGDAVRLAVFPERSEANGAGVPILRGGSIASYPLTPLPPHPIFLVDTSAWTGDSGGTVIHASLRSENGKPLVIGVVRGMRSVTDTTRESRFVERRTHYPLGISEVLHAAFLWDFVPDSWLGDR